LGKYKRQLFELYAEAFVNLDDEKSKWIKSFFLNSCYLNIRHCSLLRDSLKNPDSLASAESGLDFVILDAAWILTEPERASELIDALKHNEVFVVVFVESKLERCQIQELNTCPNWILNTRSEDSVREILVREILESIRLSKWPRGILRNAD